MNKGYLINLLLVAATAFNANAAPPQVPLTVTIRGDGAVTSDRVGIYCPTDCDEAYKKNTKITLTATANSDSNFLGWGDGVCSGTTPTCAIRIKKPLVVTALFDTSAVVYPAPDAEPIRARMERLLDYLESSGYAQMLPFDEHVVLVYQHAQSRPPTPLEFYLLTRLQTRGQYTYFPWLAFHAGYAGARDFPVSASSGLMGLVLPRGLPLLVWRLLAR